MKSIANYMDIYVWSSKFVDTLNHISAAKVFFFYAPVVFEASHIY